MSQSEFSYSPLGWDGSSKRNCLSTTPLRYLGLYWKNITIFTLSISTTVLFTILLDQHTKQITQNASYTVDTGSDEWTQYTWWSKFSSMVPEQEPVVDELWDDILPAHGIVAVDHQWAAERKIPASMSLPSDASKGVYIIDAYHQIHCLKIIRKTFYQITGMNA
ncbi:hypothetical protein ABVK25_009935 [Lepraria finkii]|uniref:Uncharacterized protein n=1 Tax=Lepraria finkii TaxID=1340010 RepID=A0ABR4AWJ0_9LECA